MRACFAILVLTAAPLLAAQTAEAPAAPPDTQGAWLGVWIQEAVDGGVQIRGLWRGGPAQRAGLRVNDILVEGNGRPIGDEESLDTLLGALAPGDEVRFVVLRGGEPVTVPVEVGRPRTVTVAPGPSAPREPRQRAGAAAALRHRRLQLGLQVTVTTPALRTYFGAPEDAGVLVTRVEPGRPAQLAGIRVGDVLVELAGVKIAEPPQLQSTLLRWNPEKPLQASLVRGGEPMLLTVAAPMPAPDPETTQDAQRRLEELRSRAESERRQALERRLQIEIDRLQKEIADLERRLAEHKSSLEKLQKED